MTISERATAAGGQRICDACRQPIKRARSEPDHRRFFALVGAAFANWPEQHEFQPSSSEHLRAWLICKAGHYDVTTIPIEGDNPAVARLAMLAAEAAVKAAGAYAFIRPHGSGLAVFAARSIAWDKLSQKDFAPIRQAVEDVIEAEVGVPCDRLLREHERAA